RKLRRRRTKAQPRKTKPQRKQQPAAWPARPSVTYPLHPDSRLLCLRKFCLFGPGLEVTGADEEEVPFAAEVPGESADRVGTGGGADRSLLQDLLHIQGAANRTQERLLNGGAPFYAAPASWNSALPAYSRAGRRSRLRPGVTSPAGELLGTKLSAVSDQLSVKAAPGFLLVAFGSKPSLFDSFF